DDRLVVDDQHSGHGGSVPVRRISIRLRADYRFLNSPPRTGNAPLAGNTMTRSANRKENRMRHRTAFAVLLVAFVARAGGPSAAAGQGPQGVVFVQTNELPGNRIAVYDRAADGTLTFDAFHATGGLGGAALPGDESDRLASQGSLVYDSDAELLFAVN